MRAFKTEIYRDLQGLIRIVILADSFPHACEVICHKFRDEFSPQEMIDDALPVALSRMEEILDTEGVIFWGIEPLQ